MKKDLIGTAVKVEDVLEATDYIIPSIEIIDSRITDWKIKLEDTVADNASCGLSVLGSQRFDPNGVEFSQLGKVEVSFG